MKRNFFAVSFVLIVLVLTSASCNLGVSVSTSGQSTGQRTGEQMEPETEPQTEPDKLSGVFTVNSSGKQVQFSKGALYWDGSSFKMEENQYDFRTWSGDKSVINGVETTNGTPTGHTGLFYWSKDVEKTYALNYDSTGRTDSDTFAFANGGNGAIAGWDVLSKEEWQFLINRKDSDNNFKRGLATITAEHGASVKGVVLLPDSWALPDGCNWTADFGSGWTTNEYDATHWASMEQAGAVFLPAAGRREGSSVDCVGDNSDWWASTPNSSLYAYYLYYSSSYAYVSDYNRYCGVGVRLVAPVEN